MTEGPAQYIDRELAQFREKYQVFNQCIEQHALGMAWCTPNRVVFRNRLMELREFDSGSGSEAVPVLIVYSHVNRPNVLDIDPNHSMVRNLLQTGNRVFLLDWLQATEEDRKNDLSVYILDAIADALAYVSQSTGGQQVNLMGICQGGTFALCHACLRPERIRKLGLVVTPVDFFAGDGLIRHWSRRIDFSRLVNAPVNIPGDLMTWIFRSFRPFDDLRRHVHRIHAVEEHAETDFLLHMDQWMHACPDQPGRAFAQFMQDFYGHNRLTEGTLTVGGERVDLSSLRMPVLNLFAEQDHLVPQASAQALVAHVKPELYTESRYGGGHIGLIVSTKAQQQVHPILGRWLASAT